MALKHKVEDITSVPEAFRGEYTESKDGDKSVWILNVEGLPQQEDVTGLKRTVEALREEKRQALDEARRKGEDIVALTRSYDTKITEASNKHAEALKATTDALTAATIDKTVSELSTKLSATSAAILAPHIEKRLRIEIVDGKALVRVLDKKGGLTADSITDLENEFRNNKDFAAVITASRASGSGAGGDRHTPGGAGGGGEGTDLNKLTPKQLAARAKEKRLARGLER